MCVTCFHTTHIKQQLCHNIYKTRHTCYTRHVLCTCNTLWIPCILHISYNIFHISHSALFTWKHAQNVPICICFIAVLQLWTHFPHLLSFMLCRMCNMYSMLRIHTMHIVQNIYLTHTKMLCRHVVHHIIHSAVDSFWALYNTLHIQTIPYIWPPVRFTD